MDINLEARFGFLDLGILLDLAEAATQLEKKIILKRSGKQGLDFFILFNLDEI